jgi:HlyD family secretion protein
MSGAIALLPRPARSDWHRPALTGLLVIFLAFGVLGGWAAIAEISGAVMAPGYVSIETNSKTIQHLEGGIISEILVKEGQKVEQGQTLLRLSDIQAKASLDTIKDQFIAERVLEARLLAERDELPNIHLPDDVKAVAAESVVQRAIADQTVQFEDRRRAQQSLIGILDARIDGLNNEIRGLEIEQESTTKQVGYINQELVGLRQLLTKQLVPLDRVLSMERERTRLEGAIGQTIAEQAKARNSIGEARMQIQQTQRKFQEDTAAAISDVRQKIADLSQRQKVAQDVMNRLEVRAPVPGTVQALKIYSIGQVIRPGEGLMEIVPDDEQFVVRAQISPNDIASVHLNLKTEVRFSSFHSRSIPVILGKLSSVSQDRLVDDATHQPYYLGLVSVDKLDVPEELRARLRAGMPAEVIISSGKRTVLNYLIAPLVESLHKSFRDS